MRRKFAFLLTAVLCNGLFLACNSSDDDFECPEDFTGTLATTEEKLLGDWVLTAMTADEEIDLTDDETDNPSEDLFVQYEECQKDASYSFGTNRTYLYEQGQTAANCENKVILGGTWELTNDTVALVNSCNISYVPLVFKDDNTAFLITDTFNVQDAEGKTVTAEVTFTYTLAAQ